jgi:hypothetical protein
MSFRRHPPIRPNAPSGILHVLPANLEILKVEPRGFEPLTSAVQRRVVLSAAYRRVCGRCYFRPIHRHGGLHLVRQVPSILTLFAAAWAARRTAPATAALHGLPVGFLVAVIFGVLYVGPFNLWGLLLFVLMIAAGFVRVLIGRTDRPSRIPSRSPVSTGEPEPSTGVRTRPRS